MLEQRIERLLAFEKWREPTKINFEAIVGAEFWRVHWNNLARFFALMEEAELHAQALRLKIQETLRNQSTAIKPAS